jgi:feruloyl esterase
MVKLSKSVSSVAGLILAAVAVAGLAGCRAPESGTRSLASLCGSYEAAHLPHGAKVTKTEVRTAADAAPEACVVRGHIVSSPDSTITWAVELPDPAKWNGKTLTIGGGGFDGFIPTDQSEYRMMAGPSAATYVRMSSNSGHDTRDFFPWATSDTALRNHAFDANHLTLEVGTQIATEFYGRKPTRRYMLGQSNGGRSGIIAIQRYPGDYDGVIAMEPAVRQQAHEANLGPTTMRHIYGARENWLNPAKVKLFADAELKACDGLDGLKDGVIGNIEACTYIPTDLLCQGADSDRCLTAGQIETIRMVYNDQRVPVTMADGLTGYPRFGRGGAATSDFQAYLFGTSFENREAFNYIASTQAAKVVRNDPNADAMTNDPTKHVAGYRRLSAVMDLTDPNMSAFADRGGKLLIWYGLADTCVSVYATADYVDRIKIATGSEKTAQFLRFLTSPGVSHNLDGPGAGQIDLLAALDQWVEKGVAPDKLVATKIATDGEPAFRRPVCPYPQFPRYNGTGDVTKAESFTCRLN